MDETKVQTPEQEYEAARTMFHSETYQNQLHAVVNGLATKKGKSIGRVLRKLVLEPLDGINEKTIPLLNDEERDLYAYCKEIMYAKSVIIKNEIHRMNEEKLKGEQNG
jgi:DNA replication initiation complex subunit (GINS family)